MERARNALVVSLTCALISATLLPVFACGPFFDTAFFTYTEHPDFPLTQFAKGNLGVVKPTYSRSYLIAAYCYLTGLSLSGAQQKEYERLWEYRLINDNFSDSQSIATQAATDPITLWQKARSQVTGLPSTTIETSRSVSTGADNFNTFENCPKQAFTTAIATLKNYEVKYGKESQILKDWVGAQDKVFCHCGAGMYDYQKKQNYPEGPFPEPLAPDAASQLKADREYQIACAHFYAMQYDQAEKEFLAISKDTSSSWHDVGLYLAARSLIRKGTIPDTIDISALREASALLEDVVHDNGLAKLHEAAHNLIAFISLRTQPDERLLSLAQDILDPTKSDSLFQNLYDYTFLFDQYIPDTDNSQQGKPRAISEAVRRNDLTDWLITYQDTDANGSCKRALEKWRASKSLPSLIAALSKINELKPEVQDLVDTAQSLSLSSPAYVTSSYYLVNLFIKKKQNSLANERINAVLSLNLPPSARNDFLNLQMSLSSTSKEFINLAVRNPIASFIDAGSEAPWEAESLLGLPAYTNDKTYCFVDDAADILNNNVPLKLMADSAQTQNLPAVPHFDLAQAVWTRAILLNRDDLAFNLTPLMKKLRPQIAPLMDSYSKANTLVERRFIATFIILKNPGMRPYVTPGIARDVEFGKIENYGDNWWASTGMAGENHSDPTSKLSDNFPPFLKASDLAIADKELKSLQALGEAPNILTANVLNYAKNHAHDARIPEALHICVKTTKFGTTDDKTSDYSKRAFQLLHKQYGKNTWANQTPYYY